MQGCLNSKQAKFAREVGVIILGVLVALGIGEVADRIRWHFDVAGAQEAMMTDYARDAGVAHERSLIAPCLARRLDEVAALISTVRRTGRLPEVGDIGLPPSRPLLQSSWETAIGTGALAHMERGEIAKWSGWFDLIKLFDTGATSEWRLWGKLAALSNSPGSMSETLTSDLVLAVADLRAANTITMITAAQIVSHSREMGAPPITGLSSIAMAERRQRSSRS